MSNLGLAHLTGLVALEEFRLSRSGVTDAGLAHLTGLTALKELRLSNTQVTAACVAELQKALPNCAIVLPLQMAADQGDADAQYKLGGMYANGWGVPEDIVEAVRWLRLAADQGHAAAQDGLGTMYMNGEGVPQDDVEAVRWFRLAADQGDATGEYNLGVAYFTGRGVAPDEMIAHMWFNLAAVGSTGDLRDRAVKSRDLVSFRLTASQRAESERLAREWDEAHPC